MSVTTLTGQIAAALIAASTVTNLCPASSIVMGEAPEGTGLPVIQINEGRTQVDWTFTGVQIERAGITIEIYAVGAEVADAIQRAVSAVLDAYRDATFATINRIMGCVRDSMNIAPDGRTVDGTLVYQATGSFTVLVEVSV